MLGVEGTHGSNMWTSGVLTCVFFDVFLARSQLRRVHQQPSIPSLQCHRSCQSIPWDRGPHWALRATQGTRPVLGFPRAPCVRRIDSVLAAQLPSPWNERVGKCRCRDCESECQVEGVRVRDRGGRFASICASFGFWPDIRRDTKPFAPSRSARGSGRAVMAYS